MPTIVVLGTLDTKGEEHLFLADRIRSLGAEVILVDVGVMDSGISADISREDVARAADTRLEALINANDRNRAIEAMGRGAGIVLRDLHDAGRVDGAITLGGGGGTTLAGAAFSQLPIGLPKLIVSTVAAGDMRSHVKGNDLTFTYAVLDIAGLNRITRRIISNAAGAIVGMARVDPDKRDGDAETPLVGITAFGVTSRAVATAAARLSGAGYEPLVFHAVGSGGESLEALIRTGYFAGVLDLTTTELADDLVGGVMSAGPDRLTAAAATGTPQVVSVGAVDMVNLGPLSSIKPEFRDRLLIQHNPTMTLMRTTPEECAELGKRLADKLNNSSGPAAVYLPLAGVSSVAVEGGPFYGPTADEALFSSIRANLDSSIKLVELDTDINNESFAHAMTDTLIELIQSTSEGNK